ncbi:RDD family protein [uncultured Draconibacterium sp.]|uniref:RDD family protein n=1 Tax=uncultured Draconibacterium sp. TaxID=1573823 RepID=UPI0029C685CB|nr:RDD family protein [uncultured Draconibacterium sp.]
MENQNYPGVFVRVKAVITDSVLLLVFMLGVVALFDRFENVPDFARIAAFVFIFLLYDPLFTSLFGGTIGHFLFGIRVKRANNPEKNILFPLAVIRYIIKALLGWLSLITVSGNKKAKAIHDMVVQSVVIYKNIADEQTISEPGS